MSGSEVFFEARALQQTTYLDLTADETVVEVATRPRNLRAAYMANKGAGDAWLQLFDVAAAASIALGTTVPTYTFLIPASDGTLFAGHDVPIDIFGLRFANGIIAAVTSTADGNTGPAIDCIVNLMHS